MQLDMVLALPLIFSMMLIASAPSSSLARKRKGDDDNLHHKKRCYQGLGTVNSVTCEEKADADHAMCVIVDSKGILDFFKYVNAKTTANFGFTTDVYDALDGILTMCYVRKGGTCTAGCFDGNTVEQRINIFR